MISHFDIGTRSQILIIDDSPELLEMLALMLEPSYEVMVADNTEQGMILACSRSFDLILLDVFIPGSDGYVFCKQLKQHAATRHIPVILMSGNIDATGEERAFDMGAADCIHKPFDLRVVKSRMQSLISRHAVIDRLRDRELMLEEELLQRAERIEAVEHAALQTLVNIVCTRDIETGGHIVRTQTYVRMLAMHLSNHSRLAVEFPPGSIELMTRSAPLHDIGKVGIPDCILHKPGPLTPEEMTVMRTHPILGLHALQTVSRQHNGPPDFLRYAKDIVISHHEKWDGSGYPHGLAGDKIPIAARLMAVADVYDALISQRTYKSPMKHDEAVKIILDGSGTHFDPEVIRAFTALSRQFADVAERHRDDDPSVPLQ